MATRRRQNLSGDFNALMGVDSIVLKQVRKNKSVVAGSQSIKKQVGFFGRHPGDWDVLSKNPKGSAKQLETSLDKRSHKSSFFSRKSLFHPSTHKVIYVGKDGRRGTKDDVGIADFSPMPRNVKVVRRDGVRYRHLSRIIKDKKDSLSQKEFQFRHKKDREDLDRIKAARRLART